MDYALSEQQQAFRETAERFAKEKLAPHYQKRATEDRIDRALMKEMGALGLIGADLPEQYGGLGESSVTAGIIIEQIAYGDFNASYVPLLASLMGGMIAQHASPDIAQEWLPKVTRGEAIIGLGLTEPRGGSDAANLILRAEKSGNGYRLNGEKTSISFSDQCDAAVIFARTGKVEDGARGVSAFFVDLNQKGVTRTHFDDIGTKPVGRGSIFFDDVFVPGRVPDGRGEQRLLQDHDRLRLQPRPDRARMHRAGAGLGRRNLALHHRAQRIRAADRAVSGRQLSAGGGRNPAHHDAPALLLHAVAARSPACRTPRKPRCANGTCRRWPARSSTNAC